MYKLLRTILFFFPAEGVHHFSMKALKMLCGWGVTRRLVTWACKPDDPGSTPRNAADHPASPNTLERSVLGLRFPNPVGLGAGFDKNALYLRELEALGFGFVEIGTVTPKPQAGNDQPRLFRLPEDQALINRMGFNNDGVEVIAARLRAWRERHGGHNTPVSPGKDPDRTAPNAPGKNPGSAGNLPRLIVGGNIGKNKVTPNEDAWKDYEISYRALYKDVDYFVVNVSSPNTPGLRELQEKDALRRILTNLQRIGAELVATGAPSRPLLLKIAPDLSQTQLDDVISLALEINLDGLVATNTTIDRTGLLTSADRIASIGAGGLSGAPLRERSTEVVRYLTERTAGRIPVIASGGIFTAEDAREKFAAGAALVQVWTGFIYEGPFIVNRICRGVQEKPGA